MKNKKGAAFRFWPFSKKPKGPMATYTNVEHAEAPAPRPAQQFETEYRAAWAAYQDHLTAGRQHAAAARDCLKDAVQLLQRWADAINTENAGKAETDKLGA